MNISDEKLDTYIAKIKTGSSSSKVSNYKKAIARLSELKTEYNNLTNALKNKSTDSDDSETEKKKIKKKEPDEKINIDNILTELHAINTELDKGSNDIKDLVCRYLQYKALLAEMDVAAEKIKNEIYKVDENKNKIVIQKIELEDLIN